MSVIKMYSFVAVHRKLNKWFPKFVNNTIVVGKKILSKCKMVQVMDYTHTTLHMTFYLN